VADPVEEAAGRLYSLPLEDFTRERDATARELRKAKEREAAEQVGKLPKPTQAAWAANALVREHRDLIDALLDAVDDLREAQEAAVAGKGAEALRDAAAAERAAVDALVTAGKKLKPGGRKPSGATLERLRTTLQAAATDEEVRDALDRGRVVADAEGGGAWGLVPGADVPATPRPAKRRAAKPKKDDKEAREAEAALREASERRQRLEAELREARAERRSRERELERAEKTADRAAGRLEAALAAAEEAREQADEATSELESARETASEARDTVARLEEQLD
jgi:hypothetical protein